MRARYFNEFSFKTEHGISSINVKENDNLTALLVLGVTKLPFLVPNTLFI